MICVHSLCLFVWSAPADCVCVWRGGGGFLSLFGMCELPDLCTCLCGHFAYHDAFTSKKPELVFMHRGNRIAETPGVLHLRLSPVPLSAGVREHPQCFLPSWLCLISHVCPLRCILGSTSSAKSASYQWCVDWGKVIPA